VASDLHCHTKISDGSMGIEELIAVAKRRGLTAISVTDHDTTAAATRAVIIGRRQELQVIHGVEFSTMDTQRGGKAHLLCYLCDTPDRLEGVCRRTNESRRKAAMAMIRKVMRYYPITPDLIVKCATGSTNIYKQHIMHALMDAGYADSIYGELYDKLFSPESGSALVPVEYPDTREVLELIHSAGGIAVLAHPVPYHNEALLEELTALGLDGVEVWHPDHNETDVVRLQAYARDHGLLTTGGSDFHGMYTATARPLGSTACPDECMAALLSYKDKKKRKNA
jgi:predicted metal-dependent phosphoesterase TrpH